MKLCEMLPTGAVGWNLAKQLMRSGTSVGANYREAQRARSRPEFFSKIGICQQEAEETAYWSELVIEHGLVHSDVLGHARATHSECLELCRILTAIGRRSSD
jgi:four helix bundle protein